MNEARSGALFRRMDARELALCLAINRVCRRPSLARGFAVVSRLGDGVLWYVLTAALPLIYGPHGMAAAVHMAAAGLLGVTVYKSLKGNMTRQRPFVTHADIRRGTAPLDRYSFPSGHTLHAVAFTLVVLAYCPALFWLVVPFAVLVALSRVVLGLHYPSDVLAGAAVGAVLAGIVLRF